MITQAGYVEGHFANAHQIVDAALSYAPIARGHMLDLIAEALGTRRRVALVGPELVLAIEPPGHPSLSPEPDDELRRRLLIILEIGRIDA